MSRKQMADGIGAIVTRASLNMPALLVLFFLGFRGRFNEPCRAEWLELPLRNDGW